MIRRRRGYTLGILVALASAPAPAQPPRSPAPPTYDCEPGRPDPATKTCRCPDGYEPHTHQNKIPYCHRLPKRTRAPKADPSGNSQAGR